MVIVADTSALLSLASGSVLDLFLGEFEVAVSKTVLQELEETSQSEDLDGASAGQVLVEEHRLEVHDVKGEHFVSSRIDKGEASCIELARDLGADFLIMDDYRALPEIEKLTAETEVAISPIVLRALMKRGLLERGKALEKLNLMGKTRDWLVRPIYEKAKGLLESGLKPEK